MELTIITGASMGIGFHAATNLKEDVITCSRNLTTESFHDSHIYSYKIDLGNKDDQNYFICLIQDQISSKKYSKINLVLNAAVLGHIEFDGINYSKEYVWEVNYFSNIKIIESLLQLSVSINIIFVTSGTTKISQIDERLGLYVATKKAMEDYLLEKYKKYTTLFTPGITATRLHDAIIKSSDGLIKERHMIAKRTHAVRKPEIVGWILSLIIQYSFLKKLFSNISSDFYRAIVILFVIIDLIPFISFLSLLLLPLISMMYAEYQLPPYDWVMPAI
jgi:short-subunit dehydrogenase